MAHSVLGVCAYPLLVVVAALFGAPTAATAQASFDGSWTILIVTEAGECDRAYRYGVQIDHGRINYEGGAGVELTGTVDRNGQVSATVSRSSPTAIGRSGNPKSARAASWRRKAT